nr:MAG TPA: hypothetical protein [Caudoviricetes sp.]
MLSSIPNLHSYKATKQMGIVFFHLCSENWLNL